MTVKYDEATGYRLCKRGHVRSPENITKRGGCKGCEKARKKAYQKTLGSKVYQRAYQQVYTQKPENKAYYKAYHKAYQQTPKCKARKKEYEAYVVRQLADVYIADLMDISTIQATPELLEIKRLSLKLHRSLKCQKQNSL